jgi:hypothetical protein
MPSLMESWGLRPLRRALRQAKTAVVGGHDLPRSKAGLSSLSLLQPQVGIPLWQGHFVVPRAAILSNLFNHTPTPIEDGWSTKRTQILDFRGRKSTYDSHNGTDFCIPRGSVVVAPAGGQVGRVFFEFNRGGLKLAIDHGCGLMTVAAHLARVLVAEGDVVAAGEPVAISGYSGLDGFATFPWGIPHVHFNTWLNGEPVDPFGRDGETSLWKGGTPMPAVRGTDASLFAPSEYDPLQVDDLVRSCVTSEVRTGLESIQPLYRRAAYAISSCNYYPTRFGRTADVYVNSQPRRECLNMPFSREDFDRCVFLDDLALSAECR